MLGQESMRDTLEIHFQKASRGGGEVDALAYVPAGWWGVAVFTEDVVLSQPAPLSPLAPGHGGN